MWQLYPEVFSAVIEYLGGRGFLIRDLFAASLNAQVPSFLSRVDMLGIEGINALQTPWLEGLLYGFPLLQLLPLFLRRFHSFRARVILIAPHWPRRPWFTEVSKVKGKRVVPYKLVRVLLHPQPDTFHWKARKLNGGP